MPIWGRRRSRGSRAPSLPGPLRIWSGAGLRAAPVFACTRWRNDQHFSESTHSARVRPRPPSQSMHSTLVWPPLRSRLPPPPSKARTRRLFDRALRIACPGATASGPPDDCTVRRARIVCAPPQSRARHAPSIRALRGCREVGADALAAFAAQRNGDAQRHARYLRCHTRHL